MDVTRKTDYALRMVVDLVREPDRGLSVRAASEANDIPYSFARSIQQSLIRSGLVESVHGIGGGYRLTRAAAEACASRSTRMRRRCAPSSRRCRVRSR